jgi:hypothetical protein
MFVDTRLGNTPQWFFERPKDWAMRVPENVRKCVAFFARVLPTGSQVEKRFAGTGFIVSAPSPGVPGDTYNYAVTAKHTADQLRLGDWVMRMNTKDGGVIDIRGNKDHRWWLHPTDPDTVDVAVSPIVIPEQADAVAVPESMFVDDKTIADVNIGGGDEVIVTGLFSKVRGLARNFPIVRTGNIALMLDAGQRLPGVVVSDRAVDAEVYLIEARSIGGLSGSPAFVRASVAVKVPVQRLLEGKPVSDVVEEMWCALPGKFWLLGVVHGHWDILPEDKNEVHPRGGGSRKKDAVNIGIAIVFPAKTIRDILYQPGLVDWRNKCDQEWLKLHGTTTPD